MLLSIGYNHTWDNRDLDFDSGRGLYFCKLIFLKHYLFAHSDGLFTAKRIFEYSTSFLFKRALFVEFLMMQVTEFQDFFELSIYFLNSLDSFLLIFDLTIQLHAIVVIHFCIASSYWPRVL